jgi:hypothetical protein
MMSLTNDTKEGLSLHTRFKGDMHVTGLFLLFSVFLYPDVCFKSLSCLSHVSLMSLSGIRPL